MIIIDTNILVDHFRKRGAKITEIIATGEVVLHPFVYGELLLGGLPTDGAAAEALAELVQTPVADASEVDAFISRENLSGTGIGYVDTHLLFSATLIEDGTVLTNDKKLKEQATRLGIAYQA